MCHDISVVIVANQLHGLLVITFYLCTKSALLKTGMNSL